MRPGAVWAASRVAILAVACAAAPLGAEEPPRSAGALRARVVAADAGHGGKDLGVVISGVREKDISLALARMLREAAAEFPGFSVALTRDADEYLPLSSRVLKATSAGAQALLSFHVDERRGRGRTGVTLYAFGYNRLIPKALVRKDETPLPDPSRESIARSRQLAARLHAALREAGIPVGEIEYGGFRVLKGAMPSVLVELGNLRDPESAARAMDPKFQRRLCRALLQGVSAHLSSEK